MGADDAAEMGGELHPDRYYLLGDAGSFFFDPGGDNDGFESLAANRLPRTNDALIRHQPRGVRD